MKLLEEKNTLAHYDRTRDRTTLGNTTAKVSKKKIPRNFGPLEKKKKKRWVDRTIPKKDIRRAVSEQNKKPYLT